MRCITCGIECSGLGRCAKCDGVLCFLCANFPFLIPGEKFGEPYCDEDVPTKEETK